MPPKILGVWGQSPQITHGKPGIPKKEGDNCPFQRIGRGLFVWKAKAGITQTPSIRVEEPEEDEVQYEVISSFGMFWRRDAIDWVSTPKILGMQQIGAKPVDFHKQVGIYLLYDGREVIYVGRATDRPLGRRLYEHNAADRRLAEANARVDGDLVELWHELHHLKVNLNDRSLHRVRVEVKANGTHGELTFFDPCADASRPYSAPSVASSASISSRLAW